MRQAGVALKLLRRHLRIAGTDPARWIWVARRALSIMAAGRLSATLARHVADEKLYSNYQDWYNRHLRLTPEDIERIRARLATGGPRPLFSVVMPVYNSPPRWLEAAVRSITAQIYPDWELCIADDGSTNQSTIHVLRSLAATDPRIRHTLLAANVGIGQATNAAIGLARGEFVVLLDHDDVVVPEALYLLWEAVRARPDAQIVFSDEDKIDVDGQLSDPVLKPRWDAELALTMNYLAHLAAIRRSLIDAVGGFDSDVDGAQDWDLILRCSERVRSEQILHIPRVLYHWRTHRNSTAAGLTAKPGAERAQRIAISRALQRRAIEADVIRTEHGWQLRRHPNERKPISVVIPTRGRTDRLRPLLLRLAADRREHDVDVVVVEHESRSDAVAELVVDMAPVLPVSVVHATGAFNVSRLCNLGVAAAAGEVVVLLDDDVFPLNDEWLTELVVQASRPEVGVVGGLLYYPDGRIRDAGILFGINGTCEHVWRGYPSSWGGTNGRARQLQEMTALTGACLALRREIWQRVGGMDEQFSWAFNDVDLCLKVRALGCKVLFTPFAEATHFESATRGPDELGDEQRRFQDDDRRFRKHWSLDAACDPRYNPCLSREGLAFALSESPGPAAPWISPANSQWRSG